MFKFFTIFIISFTLSFADDILKDVWEKYDRSKHFKSWIDADKDCQNTRDEVLIEESLIPVTFKDKKRCKVDSGMWYDLYSGKMFYSASKMDIEHVVSLKDAWMSGSQSWTFEKRKIFANYLFDTYHLLAVSYSENRSKGNKGPDKYLPSNDAFVKEYCRIYIRIKVKWNLTVTRDQLIALQKVLGDEQIVYPKVR